MNRKLTVLLLVAAMLCLPANAAESDRKELRLSLGDCLGEALTNNLELVQARIDPEMAEAGVTAEDAAYDLTLAVVPFFSGYQREKSAVFEIAGKGTRHNITTRLASTPRFGGTATLDLTAQYEDGPNPPFAPFYQTFLSLDYVVPLLRGRGREATTERLLLARGDLEMSREQLSVQAQAILVQVENAYWDLVAARKALVVAQKSLQRAEDLLALNRKKVEVGTLAPIEITQAQAGVASQDEGVIVARVNLENAEDELRRLLARPAGDPAWEMSLVPTDEPAFAPVAPDLEQAIETALSNRPELASLDADLRKKQLSERVSRNRLRHGLDLSVAATPFGNNNGGLSPGPNGVFELPGDPTSDDVLVREGYPDSFTEAFSLDNYSWSVQLTYSIPLGNRAAQANYRISALDREKTEASIRNQEQSVRVDVRKAVRGVESGAQRVAAARTNVKLQQEKLDAEQKKFQNGMSTSFEVLTFQNDLADAELREIQALSDYNKALTALENAKGTLLQARGLRLDVS